MTRMTVRDVRLHWPRAEKALADGQEIVVTRDSKPVARILPFVERPKRPRKHFDAAAHMRQLRRFWKGRSFGPSTDEWLAQDRADD
jgi:antitoxin (DNA-binding transcriptional repressor) of toxin-antitoxin stability system